MHYRKIIFIKPPSLDPQVKTGFKVVFKKAELNLTHCIHQELSIKKYLKKELVVRKFYVARLKRYNIRIQRRLSTQQMEDFIAEISRNISVVQAHLDIFDDLLEKTEGKISLLESETRKLEKAKKQDPSWTNKADGLIEGMNKILRKLEKLSAKIEKEREAGNRLLEGFTSILTKAKKKKQLPRNPR